MYGEEEVVIPHISSKTFHSSLWGLFVGGGARQKFGRFSVHPESIRKRVAVNSVKAGSTLMSLTDDPRKRIKLKNDKCLAVKPKSDFRASTKL